MIPKHELKRWAKEHHKGLENTLFPSFTPDMQELDEDGIRLDVRQSIAHGFTSMMCAAEVGLSFEEAKRFVQIATDEAGDRIRVTTDLLFETWDQQFDRMGRKGRPPRLLAGFPGYFLSPQQRRDLRDGQAHVRRLKSRHDDLDHGPL